MDIVYRRYETALTSSSFINAGHPVDPETKRSEQKMTHHVRRASSSSDQFFVSDTPGGSCPSTASSWCKRSIWAILRQRLRLVEAREKNVCCASKLDIKHQNCAWARVTGCGLKSYNSD